MNFMRLRYCLFLFKNQTCRVLFVRFRARFVRLVGNLHDLQIPKQATDLSLFSRLLMVRGAQCSVSKMRDILWDWPIFSVDIETPAKSIGTARCENSPKKLELRCEQVTSYFAGG